MFMVNCTFEREIETSYAKEGGLCGWVGLIGHDLL
jgi:hypothetical protein